MIVKLCAQQGSKLGERAARRDLQSAQVAGRERIAQGEQRGAAGARIAVVEGLDDTRIGQQPEACFRPYRALRSATIGCVT